MATISSLGDGGNLLNSDKIPIARITGSNSYILGDKILKSSPIPPMLVTGNVIVNSNSFHNHTVIVNNGVTNVTITLEAATIDPGAQVSFIRNGTGRVSFTPGTGVVIRTTPTPTFLNIAFQYSAATAYYSGSNTWFVFGDLLT
jgi:hypothetical protein